MISRRFSGVMRDHSVISSIVRRQPVQSRSAGWMTQIFTQGLSISSRFQMSSLMSAFQEPQPVQHSLKDVARSDVVNDLGAFLA